MNATWKAALGVILIFILGWFGGALTTLIVARHKMIAAVRDPQALTVMLERQTVHGLGLDADHKARLHALLLENVKERMQLQKQIQPQVWALNRQTLQSIDAMLTPEQQRKFGDNLILFKSRYGRNPINAGPEDGASAVPTSATNGAVGTPASP